MNPITKVNITKVYISDKSKDGVPFVAKATGKPYKKIAIKCTQYGDKYLSGFVNKDNENWKEGDTVEIIIKPNGEYLNFETPKSEDKLGMRVSALEVEVMNLKNAIARMGHGSVTTPVAAQQSNPQSDEYPDISMDEDGHF